MKTKGMGHQLEALKRSEGRHYFGYLMEQGTGKTWTAMADFERLYNAGQLDSVLILGPKGVHTNWIRREIPTHLGVKDMIAVAWQANQTQKFKKEIGKLFRPREVGDIPKLRILAMNWDAITTKAGREAAEAFLNTSLNAMMIADESQRIKTPSAKRTQAAIELRALAKYSRILSGTPIGKGPPDLFSQFEFLHPGLLGTTSYRAFVAEFSDLMPADHPMMKRMIEKNPRMKFAQMPKKDHLGRPIWKNLDKLSAMVEKNSFRVLKKDCLDLPSKIYTTVNFELPPDARKRYDYLEEELRIDLGGLGNDEDVMTVQRLAALIKLQQVTSGFVMVGGEAIRLEDKPPRLEVLMEIVEDIEGQFIVWARFREEIAMIAAALTDAGFKVAEYHGGVRDKDRELAIDEFQAGNIDVFIAQQQAGSAGLTLTAASTAIYYSNDFDLLARLQSEDRCHRIGTKSNALYIDIAATDTLDEKITASHQGKKDVASAVLNDYRDARKYD